MNVTFPYTVPDKPERLYRDKETGECLTQYQRDLIRMWDSMREDCKGKDNCSYVSCLDCPFQSKVCYDGNEISGMMNISDAGEAVAIVTQWAKDHPVEDKEVTE